MNPLKARFIVPALLALALLPIGHSNAGRGGRVEMRCSASCQLIHGACNDRADAMCMSTFGESEEKYLECLVAGKARCGEIAQECRFYCAAYRDTLKVKP